MEICKCCKELRWIYHGFYYKNGDIVTLSDTNHNFRKVKISKKYKNINEFLEDFPWVDRLALWGNYYTNSFDIFCNQCFNLLLIEKKAENVYEHEDQYLDPVFPLYTDCCDKLFTVDSSNLFPLIPLKKVSPYPIFFNILGHSDRLLYEGIFEIKSHMICKKCMASDYKDLLIYGDSRHLSRNINKWIKISKEVKEHHRKKNLYNLGLKCLENSPFPKDIKKLIAKKYVHSFFY